MQLVVRLQPFSSCTVWLPNLRLSSHYLSSFLPSGNIKLSLISSIIHPCLYGSFCSLFPAFFPLLLVFPFLPAFSFYSCQGVLVPSNPAMSGSRWESEGFQAVLHFESLSSSILTLFDVRWKGGRKGGVAGEGCISSPCPAPS